jgi:PIN domain nuclease of toxin-antitoxin system
MARPPPAPGLSEAAGAVTLLLDTHFLIWLTLGSKRLAEFPWIERYRPWGVSPISFLEIQFLAEIGRVTVRRPEFVDAVMSDGRFAVDDVPFVSLIRTSLALEWTRDPFDRLLAAHSLARRVPLCTLDRGLRRHHRLLAAELPSS